MSASKRTAVGRAVLVHLTPSRLFKLQGAAALLGSGVASALGLVVLARGSFPGIAPAVATAIVLFIQWELLVLTCAKWGLDLLVFAQLGAQPSAMPGLRAHLETRAGPIAICAGLLLMPVFGPAAALLSLSAILDTVATIRLAAMSAHERFRDVSIANILNYPLFFLLLAILGTVHPPSLGGAAVCFSVSSAVRLAWTWRVGSSSASTTTIEVHAPLGLGAQQALNFLLFRGDQLLLPVAAATLFGSPGVASGLSTYVFLARFPDLVSSGLVNIAPVLMPSLYSRLRGGISRTQMAVLALGLWGVMVAVDSVFALFGPHRTSPGLLIAFATAASLALPANLITYSFLRENRLSELLRALATGVVLTVTMATAGVAAHSVVLFALSIAFGLGTYVVLGHGVLVRSSPT